MISSKSKQKSTNTVLLLLAAFACLVGLDVVAGGRVEVQSQSLFNDDGVTKVFVGEDVTIKAKYIDTEAEEQDFDATGDDAKGDQKVLQWKTWRPPGQAKPDDDGKSAELGITTGVPYTGLLEDLGSTITFAFEARTDGSPTHHENSIDITVVDAELKLTATKKLIDLGQDDPPEVKLTATIKPDKELPTDVTYRFFMDQQQIGDPIISSNKSESLTLVTHDDGKIYVKGNEAPGQEEASGTGARRFHVTVDPFVNEPAGGDGDGSIFDEGPDEHPVQANEVDVVWARVVIAGGGGATAQTATTAIAGQKFSLTASIEPVELEMGDVEWNLQGTTLSEWRVGDPNIFDKPEEIPVDEEANPVSFFWVKGGGATIVKCSTQTEGMSIKGEVFFNVKQPSVDVKLKEHDAPGVAFSFGAWRLRWGKDNDGHLYIQEKREQHGFNGRLYWIRVLESANREYTRFNGNIDSVSISTALDQPSLLSGSGADQPRLSFDFLHEESNNLIQWENIATTNETYKYTLMFLPTGVDNESVPVKTVTVSWSAAASRTATNAIPTLVNQTYSAPASASNTTAYPSWSGGKNANDQYFEQMSAFPPP